jgi:uncharacterized Zn finger protein (UPF0148 family)
MSVYCPMCGWVESTTSGSCPRCGRPLFRSGEDDRTATPAPAGRVIVEYDPKGGGTD